VNTAAASAAQSAKYILLHAYSRTIVEFPAAREQTKTSTAFQQTVIIVFLVIN